MRMDRYEGVFDTTRLVAQVLSKYERQILRTIWRFMSAMATKMYHLKPESIWH